jgi:hypothetical protein
MKEIVDPLARASETPDVSALIEEFTSAMQDGPCYSGHIARAEDTRLNRWQGKSDPPDGCRWQRNAGSTKEVVRPYDGRPDTDVNLVDEICAAEVDMDMTAMAMAHLSADTTHVTKLTAAQVAELSAVLRWIQKAVEIDLEDDAELFAQMKAQLGWSVLNPGWLERWELVERHLTMDQLIQMAQQAPPGSIASQLPVIVLDPDLEDMAVEIAQQEFGHLSKGEARRIVRELRDEQETTFLDRQRVENRPTVRTLIQGYNFFIAGATGKLQKARGYLIIERFYQADLEAVAAANNWNEEFVSAVVKTAGQFTQWGEALKVVSTMTDSIDKSIEIWTTGVRQFDTDTGAAGIYCTTFSPHLKPSGASARAGAEPGAPTEKEFYAHHYLLDYAHGEYPLVQARREVTGPALDDSRGVPEMVRSDQKVIKKHQDALAARAELETNPPRQKKGSGWSKVKDEFGPGAEFLTPPGGECSYLEMPRGNPQISELVVQRIEKGTRRRFALPNSGEEGDHPALWQSRQMRNSKRFLGALRQMYRQLAILCYQNLNSYELAEIIGRFPQLTLNDLLHCQVVAKFDARAMDSSWIETVLEFITKMMVWDKGGLIDTAPLIRIGLSYIDPTLVQEVLRNPSGAQAALYQQVSNDILQIMTGNPPQLREMDASAGMQLQMAMAVIGKNPKYQQILQQDETVQENFKAYVESLQHSEQETQISPVQGRIGTATMPQTPIQKGAPALAAPGMGGGGGY